MGAVIQCSCESKFQDERYGKGMRVHNYSKAHPSKSGGWRCTVCGKEKEASAGKVDKP